MDAPAVRTAVAADEPERPRFATGGIVTSPGLTLGTGGCVWPNGPRTVAYPAGSVSVTLAFDPEALRRAGLEIAARIWPDRA